LSVINWTKGRLWSLLWPLNWSKGNFFLFKFWIETYFVMPDAVSNKVICLIYICYWISVIFVRTRALLTKFCDAWPKKKAPPPHTIGVKFIKQALRTSKGITPWKENNWSHTIDAMKCLQSIKLPWRNFQCSIILYFVSLFF